MKYTAESPYGYWISKTEIIPVIHEESHVEVAIEQVLHGKTPRDTSVTAVLLRLGYVRVVNYRDGGCGVELWKRARLSKLQRQFTSDAEHVDLVDYHRIGSYLCMM